MADESGAIIQNGWKWEPSQNNWVWIGEQAATQDQNNESQIAQESQQVQEHQQGSQHDKQHDMQMHDGSYMAHAPTQGMVNAQFVFEWIKRNSEDTVVY